MFVTYQKTLTRTALAMLGSLALAAAAQAGTDGVRKIEGGPIPVTVELSNVKTAAGPIYISIQTESQFMGMKGFGGVIQNAVQGNMSETFTIDTPGEYAVSVWHDMDDDGVFDMDESYMPQEGWGGSGNAPKDREPTFEDVKLQIDHAGVTVPITLTYP